MDNNNTQEKNFRTESYNNFEFPINLKDTIFVLTRNNSEYKDGINNMISKMLTIKELTYVNLDVLSRLLGAFGIEKLNVFSIDNRCQPNKINDIKSNKGAKVHFIEMDCDQFIKFINFDGGFLEYNRNSLYILRGGNFLDIKKLFSMVSGYQVNIGRWRGSKSSYVKPTRLKTIFLYDGYV